VNRVHILLIVQTSLVLTQNVLLTLYWSKFDFGNVSLVNAFSQGQTNLAKILQILAPKLFWIWMLTLLHLGWS